MKKALQKGSFVQITEQKKDFCSALAHCIHPFSINRPFYIHFSMVYHYWSIVDPGLKTNAAYRTYSNSHLFCDLFVSVCMSSPQKLLLYMNAKRGPLNPTVGDSVVRKRELKSRTCALHGRAAPTVTSEPTRSQADYIADVSIRGEQTRRAGSTATVTCAKLCHLGVSPLHPSPPSCHPLYL